MKRIITLSAMMLLFLGSMFAQKLSYQAVVRNSQTNELMVSTTMNVTINILGANEQVLYTETHTGVQSNMNGLISLNIGEGTTTGSLNNVDWNGASIQSIITIQGIDPITITTPVNAVPYALQAANAAAGMDQEQADWTETDENAKSYIKHKPTIPEAPDMSNYVTMNKLNDTLNSYIKAEVDPTVKNGVLTITKGNDTYTFSANTDQNVTVDVTVPEMPVVNNDTLFINYGNTPKGYFTANANTNTTITIPETVVPTQNEIEGLLQEHGFAKLNDIPTVNNDTLFLKQGDELLGYFTANANENKNINIPATDLSNYVTMNKLNDTLNSYIKQEDAPTVNDVTISFSLDNELIGQFTTNAAQGGNINIPANLSNYATLNKLNDTLNSYIKQEDVPMVKDGTLTITKGNDTYVFSANTDQNVTVDVTAPDLTGYVTVDEMKQAISDSLALFKAQLMAEVTTMLPTYMAGYMADYMAQNLPTLMQPYMEALNIHTASELTVITPNNIQQSLTLANTPKEDTEVLMYINGVMVGSTASDSGVISVNNKTVTYNPNANYGYNLQAGDKVTFVYVY